MSAYGYLTLGELIANLEHRNPDAVVLKGFAEGHSDRGDYANAAFDPIGRTTYGEMLKYARASRHDAARLEGR